MLEPQARALPIALYTLVRGGYLAVTTFFVLSGFVVMRTHGGAVWNGRNFWRYALGRVARVYPVYALSLLVVAPFILADQTAHKTSLVAVHLLLLQGWLGTLPVNWNTPAWTLSCEMFFYFLFPLAGILMAGAGWRKTLAVAGEAFVLTRAMWAVGIPDQIKPLIHLSDFLMGMAASCVYDLVRAEGWKFSGAWLYFPGGIGVAALIAYPGVLPGVLDLNSALRPLNALLLIGLALGGGFTARLLSSRAAVYLGKSSYAIYILHVPILWWYSRWVRVAPGLPYMALVVVVSVLVYRFIEEPANRFLRGRLRSL